MGITSCSNMKLAWNLLSDVHLQDWLNAEAHDGEADLHQTAKLVSISQVLLSLR